MKNVHGILHKALQQAMKNGMIRLNPTESCVLPRIVKKEIQPLTQEQIQAFLELLPGHPHEYMSISWASSRMSSSRMDPSM